MKKAEIPRPDGGLDWFCLSGILERQDCRLLLQLPVPYTSDQREGQ